MCRKLLCAGVLLVLWPRPALGNPTVHVDWNPNAEGHTGPPLRGPDFLIDDTTNPDAPDVTLKTDSLTYFIWSREPLPEGGTQEGDIGTDRKRCQD